MIEAVLKLKDKNGITYACICQNDKTREVEVFEMKKVRALDDIQKILEDAHYEKNNQINTSNE